MSRVSQFDKRQIVLFYLEMSWTGWTEWMWAFHSASAQLQLLPERLLQQQLAMRGHVVLGGRAGQDGGRALQQPLLLPDDLPMGGQGSGGADRHQQP